MSSLNNGPKPSDRSARKPGEEAKRSKRGSGYSWQLLAWALMITDAFRTHLTVAEDANPQSASEPEFDPFRGDDDVTTIAPAPEDDGPVLTAAEALPPPLPAAEEELTVQPYHPGDFNDDYALSEWTPIAAPQSFVPPAPPMLITSKLFFGRMPLNPDLDFFEGFEDFWAQLGFENGIEDLLDAVDPSIGGLVDLALAFSEEALMPVAILGAVDEDPETIRFWQGDQFDVDWIVQAAGISDMGAPVMSEIHGVAAAEVSQRISEDGDTITNSAVMVDGQDWEGTLWVTGNYYEFNTIVQINLLWDNDTLTLVRIDDTGLTGGSVQGGGNKQHNNAQIVDYNGALAYDRDAFRTEDEHTDNFIWPEEDEDAATLADVDAALESAQSVVDGNGAAAGDGGLVTGDVSAGSGAAPTPTSAPAPAGGSGGGDADGSGSPLASFEPVPAPAPTPSEPTPPEPEITVHAAPPVSIDLEIPDYEPENGAPGEPVIEIHEDGTGPVAEAPAGQEATGQEATGQETSGQETTGQEATGDEAAPEPPAAAAEEPAPEPPVAAAEAPAPEPTVAAAEEPAPEPPVAAAEEPAPEPSVAAAEEPAPEPPVAAAEEPAPEPPVAAAEEPAPEPPVAAAEEPAPEQSAAVEEEALPPAPDTHVDGEEGADASASIAGDDETEAADGASASEGGDATDAAPGEGTQAGVTDPLIIDASGIAAGAKSLLPDDGENGEAAPEQPAAVQDAVEPEQPAPVEEPTAPEQAAAAAEEPAPEPPVATAEAPAPEPTVAAAEEPAPEPPVAAAEEPAPEPPVAAAEEPAPEPPVAAAEEPAPEPTVAAAEEPAPEPSVAAAEEPAPEPSVAAAEEPAPEPPVAAAEEPAPEPPVAAAEEPAPEPSVAAAEEPAPEPPVAAAEEPAPEPPVAAAEEPAPEPPVAAAEEPAPEPSVAAAEEPAPEPPVAAAEEPAPEPPVAAAEEPAPEPPVAAAEEPAPEPPVTAAEEPAPEPPVAAAEEPAPEPSVAAAEEPAPEPSVAAAEEPAPEQQGGAADDQNHLATLAQEEAGEDAASAAAEDAQPQAAHADAGNDESDEDDAEEPGASEPESQLDAMLAAHHEQQRADRAKHDYTVDPDDPASVTTGAIKDAVKDGSSQSIEAAARNANFAEHDHPGVPNQLILGGFKENFNAVQFNNMVDLDDITMVVADTYQSLMNMADPVDFASISNGGNTQQNKSVMVGGMNPGAHGMSASEFYEIKKNGPIKHVDGNFYEFNTIFQINIAFDLDEFFGRMKGDEVVGSGGLIQFNEAAILENDGRDDLFVGGSYTEYNLVMQINAMQDSDTITQLHAIDWTKQPDIDFGSIVKHGANGDDDVRGGVNVQMPGVFDDASYRTDGHF